MLMDDNEVFRKGLVQLINQTKWGFVCADTGSISECKTLLGRYRPDVLLLDIYIGGEDKSFEHIPRLKAQSPNTKIIILSVSKENDDIQLSARYPISGYLLSSSPFSKIERAILDVAKDRVVLSDELGPQIFAYMLSHSADKALTYREKEVLKLVQEGLSNREIGQRLFISEYTVKAHVRNILEKTGSSRRKELIDL